MNLELPEICEPDEWALHITKSLNGTAYLNPPGGESFFNRQKYIENGIDLKFLNINLSEYNQSRPSFEAGLSIIDVMMFNSPKEINLMLDQYEILE